MTQPIHPMLANVAAVIDAALYSHLGILPDAETTQAVARAAVQALMEPDEGMVEAGVQTGWFTLWSTPERGTAETYKAMLRTLVEGKG